MAAVGTASCSDEIRDAADLFEQLLVLEPLLQRDDVNRLARVVHLRQRFVNRLMPQVVKFLAALLEFLDALAQAFVGRKQHATQHALLRLRRMRRQPPLRYWPVGTDFVITNGAEFFNRPLYCLNSAFRVDGGDKPEFSLYLPGRGGNLRFGIKTSAGVKWLNDAQQIVARYRPGSMVYEIRDPLLGDGELDLTVLPLSETKGVIARAELQPATPIELVWAFGGANGMKGRRNGDIGCEREPVSKFFQLRPEQCAGNEFSIATNTFVLRSKTATIAGVASAGAELSRGRREQVGESRRIARVRQRNE